MTQTAVADAGYGSEQNYEYLEGKSVEAFVKYSYFHREQQKSHQKKHPLEQADYTTMPLNEYVCPMGRPMRHIGDQLSTTKAGYVHTVSRYQASKCASCPLNSAWSGGEQLGPDPDDPA